MRSLSSSRVEEIDPLTTNERSELLHAVLYCSTETIADVIKRISNLDKVQAHQNSKFIINIVYKLEVSLTL